jgi:hypothetical protein
LEQNTSYPRRDEMKILTFALILVSLCLSCEDNEAKKQKQEDKKRTAPYQEVMPEKGRR